MTRRLAELPPPLRYLVFAALIFGAYLVLRWVDRDAAPAVAPQVAVHVRTRLPNVTGVGSPLFTHEPAGATDELAHWRRLFVPAAQLSAELARLAADPGVDEAFVAPVLELPTSTPPAAARDDSCPVTTPSYQERQTYLAAAPFGVDAGYAWRNQIRGAGVQFADVEGGWNPNHEDLPGARFALVRGRMLNDPSWIAHGTAVAGEVVGVDNGRGVTGIAPDVDRIVTSSIFDARGKDDAADAIDAAARELRHGDVLLIELQGVGPRGRFIPVEYWDDEYAAIRAATDRGVVVIEAAGNGGEDLDRKIYGRKFDPSFRDSGAIVVGAGAPPRAGFADRERLDFSNYGDRVDVQGWGRRVATLDYGDLQDCSGEGGKAAARDRHYTDAFSGTSSASPIVAGAAILVESYANRALGPAAVRKLLAKTGSPQQGAAAAREHIGPRPDTRAALEALGLVKPDPQ